MNKHFITILILFLAVFVSCKVDKNESPEAVSPASVSERPTTGAGYKISFNAIVAKDDVFHLFYNEDGTENFDGDHMIEQTLKGSNDPQDIVFLLPDDAQPLNLRFDIGSNPDLKQVKFNFFKLDYNGKNFTTDGSKFFRYFYPNGQVVCDTVNAVAKTVVKANEPYDPIIGGTLHLRNELEKLQQ